MKRLSLKNRMLLVSLLTLVLIFTIISILYARTSISLTAKTVESLAYSVREITANVDEIIINTQNVSDAFANETRLMELLDRDYKPTETGEKRTVEKRAAMNIIRNQIFGGANRVRTIDQIAAIYNSERNELFNLHDFNVLGQDAIDRLLAMDITDSKKLSRFYWFPLQDNFLKSYQYEDMRQDLVVIGSRRIYSPQRFTYPYVHIFVIPEHRLYACYQNLAEQIHGEVYIVDTQGGLLSASSIDALASREMPAELCVAVLERQQNSFELRYKGKPYFVSIDQSSLRMGEGDDSGWFTILMVPKSYVTADITRMYSIFFIAILLCFAVCGALLFYLYRQFMGPISDLGTAMKQVDRGDLNAYVNYRESTNEVGQMMRRYNRMLQSINRNMEEKIAYEKTTRDLEMQVLTSQINPHFLYNTLETIVWKAGEAGRPDIGKIASSLGKMYRLSISGGGVWVTLRQEIEHVRGYMDIQLSRYAGQFAFACEVEPGAEACLLPKLVLQPVVENIFLHAMPDEGQVVSIRLTARLRPSCLVIRIEDDGTGMSEEKLESVRTQIRTGKTEDAAVAENGLRRRSSGIGLHNVSGRLKLYMGIEEPLRVHSRQGKGTRVILLIPRENMGKG